MSDAAAQQGDEADEALGGTRQVTTVGLAGGAASCVPPLRGGTHRLAAYRPCSADHEGAEMATVDEIVRGLDAFAPSEDETESVHRLYELLPLGSMRQDERLVRALLGVLERYPDADLGAPGPVVHALEDIAGYERHLRQSIARVPTYYTVWMCNRMINGSTDDEQAASWLAVLEKTAADPSASEAVRKQAEEFLAFQRAEPQKE
jgi:hypothetical protein